MVDTRITEHGFVAAVTSELAGDTLAAAATATDTEIVLEDATPFSEDGGRAFIDDGTNSEELLYNTVDLDTDTMFLASGLTNSYAEETEVTVYPARRLRMAEVRLEDEDDDTLITARVPYSMIPLLPAGIREQGGESVIVELLRGSWVIVDIIGEEPEIPGASSTPDTTPPPKPLNVVAIGAKDAVIIDFDDPLDEADVDLRDADILGYQVEVGWGGGPPHAFDVTKGLLKQWKLRTASRAKYTTSDYKKRFWFRVRTVDAAGNKSGWTVVGPVRPVKTHAARFTVEAPNPVGESFSELLGVDSVNEDGFPLIAAPGSSAYLSSVTNRGIATAEGDDPDGTFVGVITTGSSQNRVYAGFTLRAQDADNHLYVTLIGSTTFNGVRLAQSVSGVLSDLASSSLLAVEAETTYAIRVEMSGTSIDIYVDDILYVSHSTSQFQTATQFGLFYRRTSTTLDNGQTRLHSFKWIPYTITIEDTSEGTEGQPFWDDHRFQWDDADVSWDGPLEGAVSGGGTITIPNTTPAIDETFERGGTQSTLGDTSSGQIYDIVSGSWAIESSGQPAALMGSSMIMPVWHFENLNSLDFQAPPTEERLIGAEADIDDALPFQLWFDRPTQLMIDYVGTIGSRSASQEYNLRFWAVVVDNGVKNLGRAMSQHFPVDGDPVTKWRNISGMRQYYVDASRTTPHEVFFWWGFRNDTGIGRNITTRDLQMRVWAFYRPDYSPTFQTAKRAVWTTKGMNRIAYRSSPVSDT